MLQSLTSANAQVLLQSLAAQAAQPGSEYAAAIAAAAHSQLTQLLNANPPPSKQNIVPQATQVGSLMLFWVVKQCVAFTLILKKTIFVPWFSRLSQLLLLPPYPLIKMLV